MKIVKKILGEGKIKVIPQDSDDLYLLFTILQEGDHITAKTTRKLKRTDTGMEGSERISLTLTLKIEVIEFQGFGENIRVRGTITESSEETVSLHSYHSVNIELYKPVTIIKEHWMKSQLDRLEKAQLGNSSRLAVVAMDDEQALVTQVGNHASKVLLDLNPSIPRKGSDPVQHEKGTIEFFQELSTFLNRIVEEDVIDRIVIGGPGFSKDAFYDYIKRQYPELQSSILVVEASSAGPTGIREIIGYRLPENMFSDQQARFQANVVEEILEQLGKDTGRIAYGKLIYQALPLGAIDRLVVLDSKLHDTIELRQKTEKLIQETENMGGKVLIFSTMLDSADIVKGLGGIVALLRFPLPQ